MCSFLAFSLVSADGVEFKTRNEQFDWLAERGFQVVEHVSVNAKTISDAVSAFEAKIADNPEPSDGLVLSYK